MKGLMKTTLNVNNDVVGYHIKIEKELPPFEINVIPNNINKLTKEEENEIKIKTDKMFLSDFDKKYNKCVEFVNKIGKCNQWILKKHLHIGDKFADELIDKLIRDGYISDEKVGKNYILLKGNKQHE